MKKIVTTLVSCFVAGAIFLACTTTQQRVTFNTIGTLEASTTAAVDSYYTLVLKGTLVTNDVPSVSAAYDKFQASAKLALDAVQFNTNALAPGNLVIESQDLINLINQLKGQK